MSDKLPGFRDRSIEDVQAKLFLHDLVRSRGRYRYPRSGLNAEPGTIVLFQFKARVIASARFLRDEKFEQADRDGFGGAMFFDAASIEIFDPIDDATMRRAWAGFRRFGHVKQALNPTCFAMFRRVRKHVRKAGGNAP